MRSSLKDDADPALIPKRIRSYVKATSHSTRIPECVSYGNIFRKDPRDQAELFNNIFTNFKAPVNMISL